MLNHPSEFRQPLSLGLAPRGSVCQWCGKAAVHRLSLLGGPHPSAPELFCRSCGEQYVRNVASSLCPEVPEEAFASR
jgi:hypothetical protein